MIKVLINGTPCPLVNNDNILVSKKVLDIQNPSQRTKDVTKAFLIQGTPAVNLLFSQIFNVNQDIQNTTTTNFTPDFNPNLKANISVLNDNAVVLTGYCQMLDITITSENIIQYSINAYAGIGNFFNDIENKLLTDLDLSPFNHTISRANVVSSWSPTLGTGYVYPMIDYGYDTSYDRWVTKYFKPAIFAKEYVDEIFAASGWTYTSNFLTSTLFKSLIIPCKNEEILLDNTEIYDRSALVARTGTTLTQTLTEHLLWSTASPILFNSDSGTIGAYSLHNTSGTDINTGTGIWTCDVKGTYKFGHSLIMTMTHSMSGFPAPTSSNYTGTVKVMLIKQVGSDYYPMESRQINFRFTSSATSGSQTDAYTSESYQANVGDKFYLVIAMANVYDKYGIDHPSTGSDIQINIAVNSLFSLIPQATLSYGDNLPISSTIPTNILQTDFILSLSKMFNLVFEETEYKKLKIEPADDYYGGEIVDWTEKLDVNELTLVPMGMSTAKQYKFTYDQDEDLLNKKYTSLNQRTYGDYLYDVASDFLTNTVEVKPIFAPTLLSSTLSGENDRIVSDIRLTDEVNQGQSKLRILYWGGLINCYKWNFRNELSDAISTSNDYTSYPYAGHLDNPFTPTLDINFGTPLNVYYDANIGASGNPTYTDNNLFNKYWLRTIRSVSDKNSKVLEGIFRLQLHDFYNIDFKKLYFIKEAYYRLIEVIDYDLTGLELVNCRFLKTDKIPVYVPSSKEVRGGNEHFDTSGDVPNKLPPVLKDGRTQRNDKMFEGSQGYITGINSISKGTANYIPNSAGDSYIFGSNNVNLFNGRNFIFNTDSTDVLRPGAIFNGASLEYKQSFEVDGDFMESIDNGATTIILPALKSTEYYQINKLFFTFEFGSADYLVDSGTGIITFTVNSLTTASMARVDWEGSGITAGTISKATITARQEFGYPLRMSVAGNIASGDTIITIHIFYNIISL